MDKQTIAQEFITVEEQFRLLEEKVSSHWKSSKLEICLKIVRFWTRLNCLCKVHGLQGYIGSIEESNQKVYHLPLLACLFILPLFWFKFVFTMKFTMKILSAAKRCPKSCLRGNSFPSGGAHLPLPLDLSLGPGEVDSTICHHLGSRYSH